MHLDDIGSLLAALGGVAAAATYKSLFWLVWFGLWLVRRMIDFARTIPLA